MGKFLNEPVGRYGSTVHGADMIKRHLLTSLPVPGLCRAKLRGQGFGVGAGNLGVAGLGDIPARVLRETWLRFVHN